MRNVPDGVLLRRRVPAERLEGAQAAAPRDQELRRIGDGLVLLMAFKLNYDV